MTAVIVIALLAILASLAGAGVFMLKRKGGDGQSADKRMARALALRVALSVAVFLLILLAWQLGWITPKGLPTGR